jgi:beta-N-acetylhexosaminidase
VDRRTPPERRARRRVLAGGLGIAVALAACATTPSGTHPTATSHTRQSTTTHPTSTTAPPSTTTSPTTTTTTTATSVTAGWTEQQYLAQLIMVGASFSDLGAAAPDVRAGAGGLVLFGAPPPGSGPAIAAGIASLQSDAPVKVLVSTDEEGGDIARLVNVLPTPSIPAPRTMPATMTPSEVQGLMTTQARAMARLGVNMDLAPVLDTARPTDTVADESERSFSANGATAATYGAAFIEGLRAGGVIATAKHFPGLGQAPADTDLSSATLPPLSEMSNDLLPFRTAISIGVPAVMMCNAIEPSWGSTPVSLNPLAYRYLRQLGFTGMTVTDSLDAGAIADAGYAGPQAVVKAIEAGADMAMVTTPSDFPVALSDLEQAVSSGHLSMATVQEDVARILATKGV